LILFYFFFGKNLSGFSLQMASPVIQLYKSFTSKLFGGFAFLELQTKLVEENKSLQERINDLETENINAKMLLSEAGVFAAATSTDPNLLKAVAVAFPPQIPYDILLLNKGEQDGLKVGAKVFLADRVEAGLIEEVYNNLSKVQLFSSAGVKTESILERSGEVIEIEGAGSGGFKISLPISFDIRIGDFAVTAGLPRRALAKVVSIKKDEAASLLTAFFSYPVKINGNTLFYVQI